MYRDTAAEDRSVVVVAFGGRLFGLSVEDGAVLWEHGGLGYGVVEVLVERDRIFVSADGRHMHCFTYPEGRRVGRIRLPGSYTGRPTMLLQDGRLFVGRGGQITCLNKDGQILWHDSMTGKGLGSVSIAFPGNVRHGDDVGSQ